jgi:hypothetical protein
MKESKRGANGGLRGKGKTKGVRIKPEVLERIREIVGGDEDTGPGEFGRLMSKTLKILEVVQEAKEAFFVNGELIDELPKARAKALLDSVREHRQYVPIRVLIVGYDQETLKAWSDKNGEEGNVLL